MFWLQRMQVSSIASSECMNVKYVIYIFWWMHENSNSQWEVCVKFYLNIKKKTFLLSCNFSLYLFHCFRYFHNFFFEMKMCTIEIKRFEQWLEYLVLKLAEVSLMYKYSEERNFNILQSIEYLLKKLIWLLNFMSY